ncbi:hypothetical protein [Brevundimonas sp. Root1423]|uniref:hypothetical protein n=1 Tax=Brevundimonas sp. Root1423 TaxID=1736462 RepID=UPI0006F9DD56|nr:hypothetical protein [Brevundimonas sp. Root1423]KQY96392.1 hypothetical protein ASD25_00440 [Brevundimonas sp. Root1423]
MVFVITDRSKARWQAMSDDAFPDFRDGTSGVMGDLPVSGAGLWVLCCGCWHERWVGGQEICRRWPRGLLAPQIEWARALRCQDCGASRYALHKVIDPGASGFSASEWDTKPIMAARRLSAWLAGTGVTLGDVADHLRGLPNKGERAALGL